MTTKLCNPRDISIVHTTKLFRLMPPPTPSPKSTTKALEIPVMNWRCEGDDEGENKGRECITIKKVHNGGVRYLCGFCNKALG